MINHGSGGEYTVPGMRRVRKIHFVGIGGAGMCGIAEVLKNQGYEVSGSDICNSETIERLNRLGVKIFLGHKTGNISTADVVVVSTAVSADNPEIVEAKKRRIPVVARAVMLSELMRYRYGIAISGTHGKTTTTSFIASIFGSGGLDPTFVIGGKLNAAGSNARLGAGRYFIAEADESDASFLRLQPMVAVVTNIDEDHMATYGGDIAKLKESFLEFIHHVPFYGVAVLCIDCEIVREIIPKISRKIITYGTLPEADFCATDIRSEGGQTIFSFKYKEIRSADIRLNIPGRHNVLNALAAIAVAIDEGISLRTVTESISAFSGVSRRMQLCGEFSVKDGEAFLIDDYGHHPTEIQAVIETVRSGWVGRRIIMVFQPHRYSRTRDLFNAFVNVLIQVDVLILMDVYAAGEISIAGADSRSLMRSIEREIGVGKIMYVHSLEEAECAVYEKVRNDDVVIIQGAGNVGNLAIRFADKSMEKNEELVLVSATNKVTKEKNGLQENST